MLTGSPLPALDAGAVDAVVRAAAAVQAVVVSHLLAADAVGDTTALRELVAAMPRSWQLTNDGAVEPVGDRYAAVLAPVLPGEDTRVVTRLYHLQQTPTLRALTTSVRDQLERAWPDSEPWLDWDAGLFLSSAGAVTAAHVDRHHNLLFQISGSKDVGVALPGSREHAGVVARSQPTQRCSTMPAGAQTYRLPAGSALYIPPYTVHWVRSTEPSVAMSCGWSTAATLRAGEVHIANGAMLRLGLPVQPVGGWADDVKIRAVAAAKRLRPAGWRA